MIKTKRKTTTIFTDHYSLKVEFQGIPRKQDNEKPKPTWNRGKPGGWELYESTTNEAAEKIEKVTEDDEIDINEVMKKIEIIDTKVKFKAFGKTKTSLKSVMKTKKAQICGKACYI